MVGAWCIGCCLAHHGLPVGFLLLQCLVLCNGGSLSLLYHLFCFGLCVLRDDAWVSWGSFMQAGQQCVLVHIWAGGGVGSPWDPFEPSR